MSNVTVPFVDLKAQYLSIKSEIDSAIANVCNESSFIGGPYIKEFENKFAHLYNVKHCIGVGNGTDALYISMKMLGIGPGDEVLTAASSWISTSETITQTGARPVFVDIDPDFYTIDANFIEQHINHKTRAILPVHLYGQSAHIGQIRDLCQKHGLFLIEDCAQAHFTRERDQLVGTFGNAGTLSFYPGKNLGAYGDAGAIITNDDNFAEKARMFANHGALVKHNHEIEGINSRLDALQAAILSIKLDHIIEWTERRVANAAIYSALLQPVLEVAVPKTRPNTIHSFHLYVIRTSKRDSLKAYLESKGIQTAIHYPKILPNLPAYKYLGHTSDDFPVASSYQSQILSLPMYPELKIDQIEYVCDQIKKFFQ